MKPPQNTNCELCWIMPPCPFCSCHLDVIPEWPNALSVFALLTELHLCLVHPDKWEWIKAHKDEDDEFENIEEMAKECFAFLDLLGFDRPLATKTATNLLAHME